MAFAILRDTLDDRRRAKVLSLLNGITCIIPVLAPVLGHLIMLKFPWQSLFWAMAMMGIAVLMLLVYSKRNAPSVPRCFGTNHEKIASRCLIGFSSAVLLSPPSAFR